MSTSKNGILGDTSTPDGEALSDESSPDSGAQNPTAIRMLHSNAGRTYQNLAMVRDSGGTYDGADQGAQPKSGGGDDQCNWTL